MPTKPPTFRPNRVHRPKPDARPSANARGYGRNWRRVRAQVLAEEPLCRPCRDNGRVTPAEHVDHHLALDKGGTNDRDNLVPMCHSCHSAKTVREDGGLGHAKKPEGDDRAG